MRRRAAAAMVVAGLIGASCAGGESDNATQAPAGQAARTPLPPDQQILTIGALADTYNIEPGRVDLGKFTLNTGVFDAMVRLDDKLQVENVLAEKIDFTEAANTFRFTLRKGVKFHDGAEFGAEDVKYTFDLISKQNPQNSQGLGPDSVKVIDPYVVEITPTRKNNRLVEDIAHPTWAINKRGSDPLKPMGTGPFKFVEYVKNDRFVVERFDGYWDTAKVAKPKRIVFRFVADAQAKLLALRSGELDVVMDVPRDLADSLKGSSGIAVVRSEIGAYNALNFAPNSPAPAYDLGRDPAIREAVALSIDRKVLLDRVWAGNASESKTWLPPQVLGQFASLVNPPATDTRKAGQVLDQAGWVLGSDGIRAKAGRRLSLVHVVAGPGDSDPRDSIAAAELIKEQLRKVGIETKIEVPESAAGLTRANTGEYDILHYIANQNSANPCLLADLFFYGKGSARAKAAAPGGATDTALEACRAATTIDGERKAAAEAVHQLVDVTYVVIPLMGLSRIWAMKDTVAGFVAHPSLTNQRWEQVYLTK